MVYYNNINGIKYFESLSNKRNYLNEDYYSLPPAWITPTSSIFGPKIYCGITQPYYQYPQPVMPSEYSKDKPFSQQSLQKIKAISARLNCSPEDLKALILSESGGNPKAYNKKSKAAGLIQFLPSTAKEYNLTTDQIRNMPQEQQLDYVEKYLADRKKWQSFKQGEKLDQATLYCLVLCPSYAKKGAKESLYKKGSTSYAQNAGLDTDHDGRITKLDLAKRINDKVKEYCA